LEKAQCPECGLALKEFAGTEDTQVLEIEVKAYRRVIHRHSYLPTCHRLMTDPDRLCHRYGHGTTYWAEMPVARTWYEKSR
jgi:hypothetical protein